MQVDPEPKSVVRFRYCVRVITLRIAAAFLLFTASIVVAQPATRPATAPATQPAEAEVLAEGTVTGLHPTFGNCYTDIRPADYDRLGLEAGDTIVVAFGDEQIEMILADRYDDVDAGEPVAVLHRQSLTLAIRNGNFSKTHGLEPGMTFQLLRPTE